jgi:hypothetical protein
MLHAHNPTPAASQGSSLRFETLATESNSARFLEHDETLLRVLRGSVRLSTPVAEQLLFVGDEAIVPAGMPHSLTGGDDDSRVVMGFRAAPPLR